MNKQPDQVCPHLYHPHNHLHPPHVHSHNKVQRISNLSAISIPSSNCSTSTIQKEQYWMCSRRTKLEKLLMVIVLLLSVIVIGMTIGLAVLSSEDRKSELYNIVKKIFGPLGRLHQKPEALTETIAH